MKIKNVNLLSLLVLLFVLSSCESYIAFEKMRTTVFSYVFIGTLVIGFIGLIIQILKDK